MKLFKNKTKFKDRKIGKFLAKHAPEILIEISDDIPDLGLLKFVAKLIDNKKDLHPQTRSEAIELINIEHIELNHDDMKTMKDVFKSKKFWYAVVGIIVMLFAPAIGIPEDQLQEVRGLITVIVVGLIGGQGLADFGKEANKPPVE